MFECRPAATHKKFSNRWLGAPIARIVTQVREYVSACVSRSDRNEALSGSLNLHELEQLSNMAKIAK